MRETVLNAKAFLFFLHDDRNSSTLLLFSAEGNECIKANAESCGDCIQVGAKCGWCTDTVSSLAYLTHSFVTDVRKPLRETEILT